jgi:hypothetical protein
VEKLVFNDDVRVGPDECRWMASRLRAVDREAFLGRETDSVELFGLVAQLAAFAELCAAVGGFEVW